MRNEAAGGACVADLTERELIARINAHLPEKPSWLAVGIGDDAAVIEPERNRLEVLSVDTLVDGVHFDRAFVPPDAIGHRALAVNLSDLAAMGAAPRLALLAMALPPALPLSTFDGIIAGFCALAECHRLHLAGGNLTKSPGPLMIDVTVSGTVKRRGALTRSGARAGDELFVSGSIGAARAGLAILRDQRRTTNDQRPTTNDQRLTTTYLRPDPRVRLGMLLSRTRAASACIDLSDGLADGVQRIAEASGVGITVDADALPISDGARATFAQRGGDAVEEALAGGDDYELLFTVRRRMLRAVRAGARQAGVPITRIGVCTNGGGVVLQRAGSEKPLTAVGYDHFGARASVSPVPE